MAGTTSPTGASGPPGLSGPAATPGLNAAEATVANYDALSVESATIVTQRSAWQRVRANLSVRIGGSVLALLVAISVLAPWLGTVDPTLFDPLSEAGALFDACFRGLIRDWGSCTNAS